MSEKEYHSDLRDRQKEMTRDLILEAVCDFILEGKTLITHDHHLQFVI